MCLSPRALILLVAGCAGPTLAAPLDAIWHTVLGLDETAGSSRNLGFTGAAPARLLAAVLGDPRPRPAPATSFVIVVGVPVFTGVIDLVLRAAVR